MPIEQSAISQLVEDCTEDQDEIPKNTSKVFGYYNMAGYLSQAVGSAFAGLYISLSVDNNWLSEQDATTNLVLFYAIFGGLKFIGYFFMNR
jgi:hypothetical protein